LIHHSPQFDQIARADSLRFDKQIAERTFGRRILESQGLAKGNLNDHACVERRRDLPHSSHTFTFDDDQHLGEFLLQVKPHAPASFELTREDRAERQRGLWVAEVPHQHRAVAAEQALSTIMRTRSVPHAVR
jgi:hypothetical protein